MRMFSLSSLTTVKCTCVSVHTHVQLGAEKATLYYGRAIAIMFL